MAGPRGEHFTGKVFSLPMVRNGCGPIGGPMNWWFRDHWDSEPHREKSLTRCAWSRNERKG